MLQRLETAGVLVPLRYETRLGMRDGHLRRRHSLCCRGLGNDEPRCNRYRRKRDRVRDERPGRGACRSATRTRLDDHRRARRALRLARAYRTLPTSLLPSIGRRCSLRDDDFLLSERSCRPSILNHPAFSERGAVTLSPSLLARLAIMLWIARSSIRLNCSAQNLPARALPALRSCNRVCRRISPYLPRRFRVFAMDCLPSMLAATS